MAAVTRLWPYGGPGSPYGSFSGKSSGSAVTDEQVTTLWPYGGPGIMYGSFAGKDSGSPPGPPISGSGRRFVHELAMGFARSTGRDPRAAGA